MPDLARPHWALKRSRVRSWVRVLVWYRVWRPGMSDQGRGLSQTEVEGARNLWESEDEDV
jgi:hypothetical protein